MIALLALLAVLADTPPLVLPPNSPDGALQALLDSAPPGASVLVPPGDHRGIAIAKSVTLIGLPDGAIRPQILPADEFFGPYGPALQVQGVAEGEVRIVGFDLAAAAVTSPTLVAADCASLVCPTSRCCPRRTPRRFRLRPWICAGSRQP